MRRLGVKTAVKSGLGIRPTFFRRRAKLCFIGFFCLCVFSHAHANATLFVGEPYSYDGALAGTGHAAVYLSGVCATSPIELRLCAAGETGVVLSRYHRINGHDWIAIPLIPYLYAVENQEDVPLFADKKLTAFLRDRYRRSHLESLAPDLPNGDTPDGDWYELVGASYIRTFYAYEIETDPEHDAALIRKLNSRPNRDRYDLVTANCADFVRQIIDFYHPHAVHRSIVEDLGVTTPKQLARTLSKYSRRHPELLSSHFVIPQIPGSVPRSKPIHGVLECALTAKKYMLPLFALHPYIAGSLIAGYLGHGRFDPSRNAPVLDFENRLDVSPTPDDRRNFRNRLEEISKNSADEKFNDRRWAALHSEAEPDVDHFGRPVLDVRADGKLTEVGLTRANILNAPDSFAFAAGLVRARLREELKSAAARKTASADVESDLQLLRQLTALQSATLSNSSATTTTRRMRPPAAFH